MCDYSTPRKVPAAEFMPAGTGTLTHNEYCQRASQFWVQSTISSHNMHACPHHLARIVREVEEMARPFDIMCPPGTPEPDMRYAQYGYGDGQTEHKVKRMTPKDANGARVTVKPYAPKGR